MNRSQRRALAQARIAGSRRVAAGDVRSRKLTHRLPAQICTLYVPELHGYVVNFSPTALCVVDLPELAALYTDDEASSAALTFREITGLRVAVRPFYGPVDAPEGCCCHG